MVKSCLRGELEKDLTGYLCKSRRFPLWSLCRDLVSTPDKLFSEIKTQIPNPPMRERVRRAWIYDNTWSAIDARLTARREGSQRSVRQLSRYICAGLSTDWKRRVEEAGYTIESLIASEPSPL